MISVVVPVYNVASYLPQCLDSLLSQTYKDLEIIIVNDGSTDDSPNICDSYAAKDKRMKVVHKINGGLSDARNVGIKQAIGEWIYFIDSDDWLDKDAIRKLYEFATVNNCDIVQGNMYYVYTDYLFYRKTRYIERKKNILTRRDAMRELVINDRIKNFAWGKLYKTCMIRDLKFPIGKFFEDVFWQHLVIDRIERYGIINTPLYYYRQRIDSISGGRSVNRSDLLDGYQLRYHFIQEKYPDLKNLMRNKYDELYREIHGSARKFSFGVLLRILLSRTLYSKIPR